MIKYFMLYILNNEIIVYSINKSICLYACIISCTKYIYTGCFIKRKKCLWYLNPSCEITITWNARITLNERFRMWARRFRNLRNHKFRNRLFLKVFCIKFVYFHFVIAAIKKIGRYQLVKKLILTIRCFF